MYQFFYFVFFGSAHTDCVIAEDHEVAEVFLHQVDRLVDIFKYMFYLLLTLLSLPLYCDLLKTKSKKKNYLNY
jgi:hypothetical protein